MQNIYGLLSRQMKVTSVEKHFLTSPLQDGLNQLLHTQIKKWKVLTLGGCEWRWTFISCLLSSWRRGGGAQLL